MIICALKRILHKKKAIFIQLLESPIPPLTAAALLIIICKRSAPHFDNHEKGMKMQLPYQVFCIKFATFPTIKTFLTGRKVIP